MHKWLVAYDFPVRPPGAFYEILKREFASGELDRVLQSVYIAQDDYAARRLKILAELYGANVFTRAVNGRVLSDDQDSDRQTTEHFEQILARRKRGRPRKIGSV
jgi:hypothetical protein